MANTNTNIFGSNFLDEYEHKYIWVYRKWANMNTNTIIWTDICKYKYKYYYYKKKIKKIIRYVYGYKKTIKVC